jgi:hypothetical protein
MKDSSSEYNESLACKQSGLLLLGHLLSHSKQDSNESIFKILNNLTLHPSTALNSTIAKYILDSLIIATNFHHDIYITHPNYIDSLILIANKLL